MSWGDSGEEGVICGETADEEGESGGVGGVRAAAAGGEEGAAAGAAEGEAKEPGGGGVESGSMIEKEE